MSCGIPDFRSRDGIYARLAVDFPDLPDPQAMFDIEYFRRDPRPFFKFAKVCLPPPVEVESLSITFGIKLICFVYIWLACTLLWTEASAD